MASNGTQTHGKRMEYKQVDNFDVNDIAPDAPVGEWQVSIPRGKCKVQPTKEEKLPLLIVPIRLDKTDEEGEEFQKALGSELAKMFTFGMSNPRADRQMKRELRQLCEAADVDLDIIPKKLRDPENDLEPLIRAFEGKKFTAWTKHRVRKDTGETIVDVLVQNPNAPIRASGEDGEEEEEERPARGAGKKGRGR